MGYTVEVQPTDEGRWRVTLHGTYRTQAEAETVARDVSRKLHGELTIRGLLGRFLRRDSHGNDPSNRPG
jgi:hypothetical protein